MPKRSRTEIIDDDVRDLARLGYAQQLYREMGGFSNFAVSFSIISILTGAVLLYGYGLKYAGPIVNSVGWPLVSLMTLAVAASMAEIASAYPTAGGLYYWAYRLGGRRWAWITAWLNMIGQVAITAGINIAAAIYLTGIFTRNATSWNFQLLVMLLILIPQVAINVWGIKLTARLSDLSVWWHIGGVLTITLLLTIYGHHHNSLAFLFSWHPVAPPPAPVLAVGELSLPSPLFRMFPSLFASTPALFFVLALLQAQWTYTGYDASAHMAEETVMARRNSAWGIVLSVAVSAVAGYVMLMALTWCIPNGDVAATANDAYPVLYIVRNNLIPFFAALIAVIIGVAMWLCGVASVTSMGRMWYAFARDDGMPGSRWLKRVGGKHHTPFIAIIVTSLLSVAICVYAAAWFVVTSISTICLYLAYGIPIYLNLRNRIRKSGEFMTRDVAPWNLGRWSSALNAIAILWIAFITIVFMLPPNELVLWTMIGVAVLLTLYWWMFARWRFEGPARRWR
ncbi:MAG TPA: amino acid permease, partial [Thermoanaerobaculia bacterium]|nr:amino acid permease [Thermoanaerobaculia bacterium]